MTARPLRDEQRAGVELEEEPSNFELIEQGLLRLDPETREHVIAAMLTIRRYRGDRSVFVRILAPRPVAPPFRLISSCC